MAVVDFDFQKSAFGRAIKTIEQGGGTVVHNVQLPTVGQLAESDEGADFDVIACKDKIPASRQK